MTDIITVVHDARKFAELCIKAVHLRTSGFRHIVIDNGSAQDTLKLLDQFAHAKLITLVRRSMPTSRFRYANSLDWILSNWNGSDQICLLDSDAYPVCAGWLEFLGQRVGMATGCEHFRDKTLLHPSCMAFSYCDYVKAGRPSFKITGRLENNFRDTAMNVCIEMRRKGVELVPHSREVLSVYVRHRWCATRREIAVGPRIDDVSKTDYDIESSRFLSTEEAKEALEIKTLT